MSLPLTRQTWAARVPHADAMALIDAVVHWDAASIHATGERHAPGAHPLSHPHGLHTVHLVEYAAQATAVHAVLLGEERARGGRLVSLRGVQWATEYVDLAGGRLDVRAQRLAASEHAVQYAFDVEQQGRWLASGRLTVMYVA